MPAQNAAVLPLPLDPVTTTEMRASLARSTATASSRSASRARQRPSPYFDRLNTQQPRCRKRVVPDFQDQIAAAGFFKQPDRGIGVDLDGPYRFGISGDVREHVHGGDPESKRPSGFPRQCENGI